MLYVLVSWWGPWIGPCLICGVVAYLDGGVWDCESEGEVLENGGEG